MTARERIEDLDEAALNREIQELGLFHHNGRTWAPVSTYSLDGPEIIEALQDYAKKKNIVLPEGEITLDGYISEYYTKISLNIELPCEKVILNPYKEENLKKH